MTLGRKSDFFIPGEDRSPQMARTNSGHTLPRRLIRARRRLIREFLDGHPGASAAQISQATGLSEKQVYRVTHIEDIRRARKQRTEEYAYKRFAQCPGRPETCGPCAWCVGVCPECNEAVTTRQSRTKVWGMGNDQPPHEAWLHLACCK